MKNRKLGSGFGHGHRTLRVEQLEGRALLAGNVLVDEIGGQLFITGNNNDNAVLISEVPDGNPDDNRHSYLILGFDFDDAPPGSLPDGIDFEGGDTIIRGDGTAVAPGDLPIGASSGRVVGGITGNIVIDMRGGDDVLAMANSVEDLVALAEDCGFGFGLGSGSGGGSGGGSGAPEQIEPGVHLAVERSLIITMGNGDDTVGVIADVGIARGGGSLVINTGAGNDAVAYGQSFERSDIVNDPTVGHGGAGAIAIVTGNGDDDVCLHHFVAFGGVVVDTGNNSDFVDIISFDAVALTLNLGAGHDDGFIADAQIFVDLNKDFDINGREPLGPITVLAGSGDDLAEVSDVTALSVVVDAGTGNDGFEDDGEFGFFEPISINNSNIAGPVVLNLGSGADLGQIFNVDALVVTVTLGDGLDYLLLEDLDVRTSLVVNAGAGDDHVDIFESFVGISAVFAMGTGDDQLHLDGNDSGPRFVLVADGGPHNPGGGDELLSDLTDANGNTIDRNGTFRVGNRKAVIVNFEEFDIFDLLMASIGESSTKKNRA